MLIFLYGPDTFSSRAKLKSLKEKFIREVDKSALNLENLDGRDLEINRFRQAILSSPFLAKKRMIVIENFFTKPTVRLCHEILKTLAEIKNDNIIVFWDEEVAAKRMAESCAVLFKKLSSEKFSQKFDLLNEVNLKKWALTKIKKEAGKIDSNALAILLDWIGNDLWQLNSEIDKLLAFSQSRAITAADVNLLSKSKLEENIFELTDALGQKNKTRALKLISDQLAAGLPATVLLAKITWQFQNLLQVKSLTQNNHFLASAQIAQELKLHPFVVKKSLSQIKNFTLEELKKIYRQLLEVDLTLKTSPMPAKTFFNLLVAKY